MSGASDTLDRVDTLDPIEAAEIDIAGSKDLIASVTDDLSQHQRWIENYRVSERRHARWLVFQEVRYRTELQRRALMRGFRRFALSMTLWARSIWLFSVKWTTAFIAWLTPRAHALALTLRRWIAAGLVWSWATFVAFARALHKEATIALAWIAATSRDAARALGKAASMTGDWIGVQLVAIGHALRRLLYRVWLQARVFARASLKAASIAFAWSAVQSAALAHTLQRLLYRAWLQARILARASLKAASIASAWIAVRSAAFAHALQRLLYRAWLEWRIFAHASLNATAVGASRAAKNSRVFARAARKTAVAGSSRAWAKTGSMAQASFEGLALVAAKSQRLFDKRVVPPTESLQHTEAAIISQCTALICIEPWRARLPAIRELSRAKLPISQALLLRSAARPPA